MLRHERNPCNGYKEITMLVQITNLLFQAYLS